MRDEEAVALLKRAAARTDGSGAAGGATDTAAAAAPDPPAFEREITLTAGDLELAGHLAIPDRATGVVILAHGSGSSRCRPGNRFVAAALNQAGLGTLQADLLTPEEALRRANVFDVRLLAARLTAITRWLHRHPAARGIPLGYFGASTGAAAALWAAAADPRVPVAAVVSRGGRPDLAGPQLASVRAARPGPRSPAAHPPAPSAAAGVLPRWRCAPRGRCRRCRPGTSSYRGSPRRTR